MFKSDFFKKYLLPGFMFQSVVIVGGYGTGRELMEYFLTLGPISGMLAMGVTTIIWGILCALTFDFARSIKGYDYRSFFMALLGPKLWYLFEISYLCMVIIVLAIIAATTGSVLSIILGYPFNYGAFGLAIVICFLTFKGSKLIEVLFSYWSVFLYITYITFFLVCFALYGDQIQQNLAQSTLNPGWIKNGVVYASYNLGFIPAIFFCLKYINTRKEALCSGVFAGVCAMLPGFLFLIAALSFYPEVVPLEIPSTYIMQKIGNQPLLIVFHIVLLGSLIETGVGMIHAVNERLTHHWTDSGRTPPASFRLISAIILLSVSVGVAQLGLSWLIAKGYGTLTWFFLIAYIIPLIFVSILKVLKKKN